jgi:hypothetical protein
MTGRRRTVTDMTTCLPVETPDRRSAQRIPVQIMVCVSAAGSFLHVDAGE